MDRLSFLLFAACLFLSAPAQAENADGLLGLNSPRYHLLESEALERPFHVHVRLPEDYDNSVRPYPTVYLLDGGVTFPLLAAYYRYLHLGGEAPDMILVGISYGGETFEEGNYRSTDYTAPSAERDYWGGAENFQTMLREELLPLIERKYRADPERRIMFGQSLGGQFVLYTALTDPNLFWGHIASNPALHRNLEFFLEYRGPDEGPDPKVFVSSGSHDDERFRAPALAWIDHWTNQAETPWALKTVTLDGHSHFSAPPAAFRAGIAWLFTESDTEPEHP